MAKTDLGDKQVCPNCGAKFYDLRQTPGGLPQVHHEHSIRPRRACAPSAAARASPRHEPGYDDDEELEAKKAKKAKSGDEDEDDEDEAGRDHG